MLLYGLFSVMQGLALEIMPALMAVVDFPRTGKPALAFPDIALAERLLDNCHPPVDAHQNRQTDHPLNGKPDQINPTENKEPETSVLTGNIG